MTKRTTAKTTKKPEKTSRKTVKIEPNEEKEKEIKKEINRLKRQLKEIDKKKKDLVNATIEDVAFMTVTMKELRERIIRDGTTIEYKNGENQYGQKQSPDAQLYLQMSQKQTQAMKILLDCIPKTERPVQKTDEFTDFLGRRFND